MSLIMKQQKTGEIRSFEVISLGGLVQSTQTFVHKMFGDQRMTLRELGKRAFLVFCICAFAFFVFVFVCCENICNGDQSDQVAGDRRMTLRRRRGVLASLPSPYPVTCTNFRTLQLCFCELCICIFVFVFVFVFMSYNLYIMPFSLLTSHYVHQSWVYTHLVYFVFVFVFVSRYLCCAVYFVFFLSLNVLIFDMH